MGFCCKISLILLSFTSCFVFTTCSGRVITKLLCSGEKEVDLAVQSAKAAFQTWSRTSGMERCRVLLEAARLIRVLRGALPPTQLALTLCPPPRAPAQRRS